MMGALLLATGLCLADSVEALLGLFPPAILGVVLLLGGLELLAGVPLRGQGRAELAILLLTAGLSLWNAGAGFVAGLGLWHAWRRWGGARAAHRPAL
jgi:hypothetical protein